MQQGPPAEATQEVRQQFLEERDGKLGATEEREEAARILEEKSPMDDAPLRDESPVVETIDLDDAEDNPEEFVKARNRRQPGEPNPDEDPLEFLPGELDQARPLKKLLKPEEMVGRSFLMPEKSDRTRERARITELITDCQKGFEKHPE